MKHPQGTKLNNAHRRVTISALFLIWTDEAVSHSESHIEKVGCPCIKSLTLVFFQILNILYKGASF